MKTICTNSFVSKFTMSEFVVNKLVYTYRSAHFCFACRCPYDYHAICYIDPKRIQCLSNDSEHVSIYLYSFWVI